MINSAAHRRCEGEAAAAPPIGIASRTEPLLTVIRTVYRPGLQLRDGVNSLQAHGELPFFFFERSFDFGMVRAGHALLQVDCRSLM